MAKGLVRYQQSGCFHFLTFSCYRRQPLLDNATARGVFECELEAVRIRHGFEVAGYVLMPEHVHLLAGEEMNCQNISGEQNRTAEVRALPPFARKKRRMGHPSMVGE